MTNLNYRILAALLAGIVLGAAADSILSPTMAQTKTSTADIENLANELEAIKSNLPDQAHAMQDVGYHFSNLWFAGQHENWPLADFYWAETRSHLRWAVGIIPKRKDNAGQEVDLEAILEGMENGPLAQLHEAIKAGNKPAFENAYRFSMENCYAYHKASDKPFIRSQIPTQPDTSIIDFHPMPDAPQ